VDLAVNLLGGGVLAEGLFDVSLNVGPGGGV
jgi:hypothetical protein